MGEILSFLKNFKEHRARVAKGFFLYFVSFTFKYVALIVPFKSQFNIVAGFSLVAVQPMWPPVW